MNKVGTISDRVADLIGDPATVGTPIMLGETNIDHMEKSHPEDYAKYGRDIALILACPDYIGKNPKDQSVEYVKEYQVDGEYVKVAVRVSAAGTYFARSIYTLNRNRANNFIKNGTLIKVS